MTIEILLATYNSEAFLAQQIDSIVRQDCQDWILKIRDGGSFDSTLDIIDTYRSRYPDRIHFVPSLYRSAAKSNFSSLIEASTSPYVMLSDHDDVWLPHKVRLSLETMKAAEQHHGTSTPILVYTDKFVVDRQLNVLCDSCFRYEKLDPSRVCLESLLVQNVPSGCTMLVNRALVDKALPMSDDVAMHDHWLSLVASTFGRMAYIKVPTLLYRQHDDNIYGAYRFSIPQLARRLQEGRRPLQQRLLLNIRQAAYFLKRFKKELPDEQVAMLNDFIHIQSCSSVLYALKLFKHRIFKHGILRNIGMLYILTDIKENFFRTPTTTVL